MKEIGYQADGGLLGWGRLTAETHETNPDLQWPQSIDVFDRMRREDTQVKSVLRAVKLPIMRTEWVVDGAGCRPEVTKYVADNLGLPVKGEPFEAPLRLKGRFSFKEFLRLALLELDFGHSFFEQVYDQSDGSTRLAKLAWRPPRTIADVEVAPDGGLVAIKQRGISGGSVVTIPVDRLVAFVNEREGANWLGESILRSAYKMWLLKDRLLRVQALTAERNGLGIPTFTSAPPPEGSTYEEAEEWMKREIDRGLEIAKAARAGESAGVSLAADSKFALTGVTGRLPDTDKPIRYYDEQIAGAVLANFLSLGGDNATGSYALGATFVNFFTDSLNATAQHIAEVVQSHVVEDLVDLNWGSSEPSPRVVPAVIGETQTLTADAVRALIDCGALTTDPALEEYLRAKYGMPVKGAAATPDDDPSSSELPTDAELARNAAEVAQKVYLATDKKPLTQAEAREIIRRAGADITGSGPEEAA